ncbi:MAG: hypothetical protein GY937_03570 [bacterium]|nr:hypothetical protein [bacterium]
MILFWSQGAGAVISFIPTYVEDFNLDSDPAASGFADAVFVHSTDLLPTNNAVFFQAGEGVVSLAGEAQHSLFLQGGLGTGHTITFTLAPGEVVTEAAIYHEPFLDSGRITWFGTLGTFSVEPIPSISDMAFAWAAGLNAVALHDSFYAAPTDIGYITGVQLNGHDTNWDHLMIKTEVGVLPAPSSGWLLLSSLVGFLKISGKGRSS